MNSETIKANEKRFFEYVNKKDTEKMEKWIDEFVADDFINHSPVFDVSADKEGLKAMFRMLFQHFPDVVITIKEMVFENDILCFRHVVHGMVENKEDMGIAMIRCKNGKMTDRWVVSAPQ